MTFHDPWRMEYGFTFKTIVRKYIKGEGIIVTWETQRVTDGHILTLNFCHHFYHADTVWCMTGEVRVSSLKFTSACAPFTYTKEAKKSDKNKCSTS